MKLNLGCGFRKLPGYLNVDKVAACAPDRVVDLERLPWPFETDSADEVVLSHVLEHLGRETDVFLGIMGELYRVCRAGAEIRIVVPHPRHDDFLSDPTHVRPITLAGLELFSRRKNREWQAKGHGQTPLAQILDVDFEIVAAQANADEPWRTRLARREISAEEMAFAVRSYNNVVKSMEITLKVIKDTA